MKKKLEVEREVDLSGQNKMAGSDGHKRETPPRENDICAHLDSSFATSQTTGFCSSLDFFLVSIA